MTDKVYTIEGNHLKELKPEKKMVPWNLQWKEIFISVCSDSWRNLCIQCERKYQVIFSGKYGMKIRFMFLYII